MKKYIKSSLRSPEELNAVFANRPDAFREYEKKIEDADREIKFLEIVDDFDFYGVTQTERTGIPLNAGVAIEVGSPEFEYYLRAGMADIIDEAVDYFKGWNGIDEVGAQEAAMFRIRLDATQAAIDRARKDLEVYG